MTHSVKTPLFFALFSLGACTPDANKELFHCASDDPIIGQYVAVPSGTFTKARQTVYREEGNPQDVKVAGFDIQVHEVTNQQFSEFIDATGYVTDAEKDKNEATGSALFKMASETDNGSAGEGSWSLINGVNWRQPEGLGSTIEGKENYPVVHVSNNDAQKYAEWAGGRLPTETEWEYVASLGLPEPLEQNSGAFDSRGQPIAKYLAGYFPYYR